MGLDVSAYVIGAFIGEGEPCDLDGLTNLWNNKDFPSHAEGLASGWYEEKESRGGPCISYGSYKRFREWLAQLVGLDAEMIWCGVTTQGAFVSLINFSDCEGTIGPKLVKAISQDFEEWAGVLATKQPSFFTGMYEQFRALFAWAAERGAVVRYH